MQDSKGIEIVKGAKVRVNQIYGETNVLMTVAKVRPRKGDTVLLPGSVFVTPERLTVVTYPRRLTHTAIMGNGGKGKPTKVIDGDRVMQYVGIGWIHERDATDEDRNNYPTLVDEEN